MMKSKIKIFAHWFVGKHTITTKEESMKAINFPEANVKFAENQEQYETLPACINQEDGSVTSCFKLSEEELKQVNETGVVWLKVLTFGKPLQPVLLTVNKEEVIEVGKQGGWTAQMKEWVESEPESKASDFNRIKFDDIGQIEVDGSAYFDITDRLLQIIYITNEDLEGTVIGYTILFLNAKNGDTKYQMDINPKEEYVYYKEALKVYFEYYNQKKR